MAEGVREESRYVFGMETNGTQIHSKASSFSIPTTLLSRIANQLKKEENKDPRGFRHTDPVLEMFCMNAWIQGGRHFYEILYENFKSAFPSPRSIESKLDKFEVPIREGELNLTKLKKYLIEENLPLIVSIAEDGTGVVGRREYCAKWNSIVGCSLPLQHNGLPDPQSSVVKNVNDIQNMFENYNRASVVIVVMVQPLSIGAPAMRLCSFGSDNKFTAEDVQRRLETIITELKKWKFKY